MKNVSLAEDRGSLDFRFDFISSEYSISPKYQNKYSVKTGKIVGLEAFGRLIDLDGRQYFPQLFLPYLKASQQVDLYTKELLSSVLSHWHSHPELDEHVPISFTIEPGLIQSESFFDALVRQSQLFSSKTNVTLQFNAAELVDLDDECSQRITLLVQAGYRIAIALGREMVEFDLLLQRFDLVEVRLLPDFTQATVIHNATASQLDLILSECSRLNVPVTAMGVDSKVQYAFIKNSGVSYIQGAYLGEEKDGIDAITDALNIIQAQNHHQHDAKLLCFTNDKQVSQQIDMLFSAQFDTLLLPLTEAVGDIPNLSQSAIVLMDLTYSDDFKTCKHLIGLLPENIPTLFLLPASTDYKTRIDLLVLGLNDVIEKPVSTPELLSKIESMSALISNNEEKQSQLDEAQSLAYQAMQDASYYGQIVALMKNVSICSNQAELRAAFFSYMNDQGLDVKLYLDDTKVLQAYSSADTLCSHRELKVFSLLRDGSRLHEFGNRLMVNDVNVSFLIKNLPRDEALRGRVRDYVAVVIECIQGKLLSLIQKSAIESAVQELADVTQASTNALHSIHKQRKAHVENICDAISTSFHQLDLSLEQEDYLTGLVVNALDNVDDDEDALHELVGKVETVISNLDDIASKKVGIPELKTTTDSNVTYIHRDKTLGNVELF